MNKTNLLFLVFLFACFFIRVIDLENTPLGLNGDGLIAALDVIKIKDELDLRLFYPIGSQNYEPLQFYLLAFYFSFVPLNILTHRLFYALIGCANIIIIYYVNKDLFDERVGLVSAVLMGFSRWHIHLSRTAVMGPTTMVPLFFTLSTYFLYKALRSDKLKPALLGGFFIALNFYTYPGGRVIILVVALYMIYLFLLKKLKLRTALRLLTIFLVLVFPLLYFNLQGVNLERISEVTYWDDAIPFVDKLITFFSNYKKTMIDMLFFVGEPSWQYNYPGHALLSLASRLALPLGVILLIFRRGDLNALLLIGLLVFPFSSASSIDSPQSSRSIVGMNFIYTICAFAVAFLFDVLGNQRLTLKFSVKRLVLKKGVLDFIKGALLVFLFFDAFQQVLEYFEYATNPSTIFTLMGPEVSLARFILDDKNNFYYVKLNRFDEHSLGNYLNYLNYE